MRINLLEYFIETAEKYPTGTAVVEGDEKISFHKLKELSAAFACEIVKTENAVNQVVAVFLPKSTETVVANMAITFSGNIYMNLDVKAPIERLKSIVSQIQPKIFITNKKYLEILKNIIPNSAKICVIDGDYLFDKKQEKDLLKRLSKLIDTDPYCIINTSGSTGTPKSVVLNHRSFIDFTEFSIETLKIGKNEIIGSLSPSVFDIYSHELCMMMSRGSTIVLLPENLSAFPIKILEIMQKEKVSYIFWVPTIMVNIANMDLLSKINLVELRTVWFAGEVLPTKQYNYWHKYLPHAKFVNLYGPIEITLDCAYYVVEREFADSEPLPIGFACRNTSLLILNEKNEQCHRGEEGELCVRGTSLAMGYFNDFNKTNVVFVQNPLNKNYPETIYRTGDIVVENNRGELMFKGRRDTLIKHLGYRIELGEIEHIVVNSLRLAANCCAVYDFKNKEIILFYENLQEISVADFRRQISQFLPKYMIPTKYVKKDKMPINANGKIDRLKLNKEIND